MNWQINWNNLLKSIERKEKLPKRKHHLLARNLKNQNNCKMKRVDKEANK